MPFSTATNSSAPQTAIPDGPRRPGRWAGAAGRGSDAAAGRGAAHARLVTAKTTASKAWAAPNIPYTSCQVSALLSISVASRGPTVAPAP